MIEILGIKNAAKLVPIEDDAVPVDPVQENMNLLMQKPVKAFLEQNHEAHIQTHMAAMQNPKIQQMMKMNPAAQAILAAGMAHINEHVAFQYRLEVERMMGASLPPMEDKNSDERQVIPPHVADQIAVMAAQATQQLFQRDQQAAQQQAAQQQMQDPVVQMQMQELQLRAKELEIKEKQLQIDATSKADELELRKQEIEGRLELEAMKVGANIKHQQATIEAKQTADGVRMGIEMSKAQEQSDIQRKQAALKHMAAFKQADKKPTGE
jgi:hypothetical protein